MSTINNYQIVSASHILGLAPLVAAAIGNGWQPFGSPFICNDGTTAQAMVKFAS